MDVMMYSCVGSFHYMGFDVYERLTRKLALPLYLVIQIGGLLTAVFSWIGSIRWMP